MPCDSRVTATQMTDHEQLASALEGTGWVVEQRGEHNVSARSENGYISFTRSRASLPFVTSFYGDLVPIQRKYAEVGVRKWAKKQNFQVASFDGTKMRLVNRRG